MTCGSSDLDFTVFTATYNRAETLGRTYESLKKQSSRRFEWLIVDDGSTDGTGSLVRGWIEEGTLSIRYYAQANAGKHVAFNQGVVLARGRLFLNLDSDDEALPNALETFLLEWNAIPEAERGRFSGVTARCMDDGGKVLGRPFPESRLDASAVAARFRFKLDGELWGFHKTEILRKFPFPVHADSQFVTENIVWFAVARSYLTRFVDVPLRIYHKSTSQLSRGKAASQAQSLSSYNTSLLNEYLDFVRSNPKELLMSAVRMTRFSFHMRRSLAQQIGSVRPGLSKALVLLLSPLGYALFVRDKRLDRDE